MTDYSFITTWHIDAPRDAVWQVIVDPRRYPAWWPYVARVDDVRPGDERGIGQMQRVHWKTALPYTLSFTTRVTRIEPPALLELVASGELEGLGRWELTDAQPGTVVRYTWEVRTTKWWMKYLAPVARPAFAWNHDMIMTSGGTGLATRLSARLLRNESGSDNPGASNGAGPMLAGLATGAGLAVGLRRVLRRK